MASGTIERKGTRIYRKQIPLASVQITDTSGGNGYFRRIDDVVPIDHEIVSVTWSAFGGATGDVTLQGMHRSLVVSSPRSQTLSSTLSAKANIFYCHEDDVPVLT